MTHDTPQVQPGTASAALAAAAAEQEASLNAQDVSSILWACAVLNHDPLLPPLSLPPSPLHAASRHEGEGGEQQRRDAQPRRDTRLRGGQEEEGEKTTERLSWLLLQRAGRLAPSLEARHVCNTLWATASLGLLGVLSSRSVVALWSVSRRASAPPTGLPHLARSLTYSCASLASPACAEAWVYGTRGDGGRRIWRRGRRSSMRKS